MVRGYVQVYTGSGKGKTTASLGLALRATGAGLKVYFGQFVKGMPTSELNALEKLGVIVNRCGTDRFITSTPSEDDRKMARKGLVAARAALQDGSFDVVILDEILVAADIGLIDIKEVLALAREKKLSTELVLTGRNASKEIVDLADLVTEMKEIKHYYTNGVAARKGIEL